MRILVTNDDGVFSEGLKLLAEALGEIGDVLVVAPDREQSASGHSLTLNRPLRIRQVREHWFTVDGTPTDCVNLAVHGLFKEEPPEMVVSGVNFGLNLGNDVTYSGTVSAAFEASLHQLPAIAFSQEVEEGFSFEAAAALDWPKDKLHIQSLDDSTDGTTAIAREAVAAVAARGIDAELIHREDRAGFKAGALQFGIEKAPHPFVAILDVDYVPAPDFLKQCMKALLAEEKLAFAQARFDFLNGEENWLTRAQVLMLDTHLAIEQATRSWSGQVLPFNGTCGVWRRAAIVDAGGWQGDTLAEDMDLSYRAHLKGWHAEFLVSVPVLGELPTTVASWTLQQKRWSKGFAQVAKKMLPRLRGSGFNATQMRGALIHLLAWWAIPLFGLAAVTGIVGLFLQADSMPYMVAEIDGGVRGFAYVATYRPRSAYRHTVENSIYVAPDWHGKGIAAALLEALIERCTKAGYRQMVAVIGDSGNRASVALHERLGFRLVGTLKNVGRKHDRWVDTVLMQRPLGAADGPLGD